MPRRPVNLAAGLLAGCCLLLAGCAAQETIYGELSEREANEMVTILQSHGLTSRKMGKGKGLFAVRINSNQFPQAVQVLRQWGYPRHSTTTLGELFKPSGLVPTPMEEQVKYIHGLSEELAATIQQIDGVNRVRVHISLDRQSSQTEQILSDDSSGSRASKASVLVIYDPARVLLGTLITRVKRLTADSVPRLDVDDVVVLAQEQAELAHGVRSSFAKTDTHVIGRVEIRKEDTGKVATIFGSLAGLAILLLGANLLMRSEPDEAEEEQQQQKQ